MRPMPHEVVIGGLGMFRLLSMVLNKFEPYGGLLEYVARSEIVLWRRKRLCGKDGWTSKYKGARTRVGMQAAEHDIKTLQNASRVCRTMRKAVLPQLFMRITAPISLANGKVANRTLPQSWIDKRRLEQFISRASSLSVVREGYDLHSALSDAKAHKTQKTILKLIKQMPKFQRVLSEFPLGQDLMDYIFQEVGYQNGGVLSIRTVESDIYSSEAICTFTCSHRMEYTERPLIISRLFPRIGESGTFRNIGSLSIDESTLSDEIIGLDKGFEKRLAELILHHHATIWRLRLSINVGNKPKEGRKLGAHDRWQEHQDRFNDDAERKWIRHLFSVFRLDRPVAEHLYEVGESLPQAGLYGVTELTLCYNIKRNGRALVERQALDSVRQFNRLRLVIKPSILEYLNVKVSYNPEVGSYPRRMNRLDPTNLWLDLRPDQLSRLYKFTYEGNLAQFINILISICRKRQPDTLNFPVHYFTDLRFEPLGVQSSESQALLRTFQLSHTEGDDISIRKLRVWPRILEIPGLLSCVFFPYCISAEALKDFKKNPSMYGISKIRLLEIKEKTCWNFLKDLQYFQALEKLRVGLCGCLESKEVHLESVPI
ncbi:hypothetical protein BJ508DRAFT_307628 [Ascobolus immersus RN42]|uniref:Uncharacterized protein n=1 Tax=Ascobolus immersus RN42 TaxID=1160509 RepID=A0A3N4IEV2_ASCIM|nr:hypothetical protein BJ508DRAFT_307628 [Ascobolus immersus RN42]